MEISSGNQKKHQISSGNQTIGKAKFTSDRCPIRLFQYGNSMAMQRLHFSLALKTKRRISSGNQKKHRISSGNQKSTPDFIGKPKKHQKTKITQEALYNLNNFT